MDGFTSVVLTDKSQAKIENIHITSLEMSIGEEYYHNFSIVKMNSTGIIANVSIKNVKISNYSLKSNNSVLNEIAKEYKEYYSNL